MKNPEAIAAAIGSAALTSLAWWFGHDVVHASKIESARSAGVSQGRRMQAEQDEPIIARQADEIDSLRASVEELSGIYVSPK